MKKTIIAMALVYGLSTLSVVNAAEVNVNDVPSDHWAYPAIQALIKDGIIDGYSDGTFKGDKTLSRYEMAQVVEKAIANSAKATVQQKYLIDKLGTEFALEINKIDVRVKKVEENQKKLEKSFKETMQVKFDLSQMWTIDSPPAGYAKLQGSQQWTTRFRLYFSGDINENTSFMSRVATTFQDYGASRDDTKANLEFERGYFTTKNAFNFFDSIIWGRQAIRENGGAVIYRANNNDGITLIKNLSKATSVKVGAYAAKAEDANHAGNDVELFSMTHKVSPNLSLTGAYLHNNISTALGSNYLNYAFSSSDIFSVGAIYKMGGWMLSTEYDKANLKNPVNVGSNPYGYSIQLTNGTVPSFGYTVTSRTDTSKRGNSSWTIGYHYHQAGLTPAGFGTWNTMFLSSDYKVNGKTVNGDGTKGWMITYQYAIAKGIQLGVDVVDYKSTATGKKLDRYVTLGLNADF